MKYYLFVLGFVLLSPLTLLAHPGNTDSNGFHYCWTNCAYWGETYGVPHYHPSSIHVAGTNFEKNPEYIRLNERYEKKNCLKKNQNQNDDALCSDLLFQMANLALLPYNPPKKNKKISTIALHYADLFDCKNTVMTTSDQKQCKDHTKTKSIDNWTVKDYSKKDYLSCSGYIYKKKNACEKDEVLICSNEVTSCVLKK